VERENNRERLEQELNQEGSLKQLYFLHIPKTAGKYVSANIKKSLDKNNIPYYISTHYPNNKNFVNKAYISMHAGTYPIDLIDSLDVAVVVRHPVEARLSYFNFIYNRALFLRDEYIERKSTLEKLRYYLFEDPNFKLHNNYQSRFICNSADERSFDPRSFYTKNHEEMMDPFFKKGEAFTWFVGNEKTSQENAMEAIKKFKIVNSLDNIAMFEKNISDWFNDNYQIEIDFDQNNLINYGSFSYGDEKNITTEYLMSLISEEDIDLIIKNNDIDYFIYNYVKDNETNGIS
jgi:hypothetical protein